MLQVCSDPRRLHVYTKDGLAMRMPIDSVAAFRTGWHAHSDPQMTVRQHAAETAAAFTDDMEVFGWALQMIVPAAAVIGAPLRWPGSGPAAHAMRMADAKGMAYLSVDAAGGPALILLGD